MHRSDLGRVIASAVRPWLAAPAVALSLASGSCASDDGSRESADEEACRLVFTGTPGEFEPNADRFVELLPEIQNQDLRDFIGPSGIGSVEVRPETVSGTMEYCGSLGIGPAAEP